MSFMDELNKVKDTAVDWATDVLAIKNAEAQVKETAYPMPETSLANRQSEGQDAKESATDWNSFSKWPAWAKGAAIVGGGLLGYKLAKQALK